MDQKSHSETVVQATPEAAAHECAQRFIQLAQTAIAKKGTFSVALSGGSTPQLLYTMLATPLYQDKIDWRKVYLFWGDERFVPPDDPESNFQMAQATLLSQVPLPPRNIYRVPTVNVTPEVAAEKYSQCMASFFGAPLPRFDLILLGLGPDGHTASLFPGCTSKTEPSSGPMVVVKKSPKPPPIRLTLSLESINHAANIIFFVAGSDKAAIVRKVFQQQDLEQPLPAQLVQPTDGTVVWLLDKEAARHLHR